MNRNLGFSLRSPGKNAANRRGHTVFISPLKKAAAKITARLKKVRPLRKLDRILPKSVSTSIIAAAFFGSDGTESCDMSDVNTSVGSLDYLRGNNNNNSNYLYSAISPELKFCSEALVTTLACLYNTMLKKYNVKSHIKYHSGKVKHTIYVNNKKLYIIFIGNDEEVLRRRDVDHVTTREDVIGGESESDGEGVKGATGPPESATEYEDEDNDDEDHLAQLMEASTTIR